MMRRTLLLVFPIVAVLCGGLGWYVVVQRGNLLADAYARLARGDLHGAQIDLDTYVRRHPGDATGEFRLGLVELALDNPLAAARELRLAGAHGYDKRAIILPLGETYSRQRLYDQALEDFDPGKAPPGGRADIFVVRAAVYLALKQVDDAANAAMQAEAEDPSAIAPKLAAARVALARNAPGIAAAKLTSALQIDPASAEAQLLKGEIALHQADPKTALGLAQNVLRANPADNNAKMMAARAYAALNQAEDAIPLLDQVARAERRNTAPRFLRAVLADKAHDFATADANLSTLSGVIDDLPQGNYYLGVTKLGLGQVDQAQDAAAKYHARVPDDPNGTKLLALTDLALHRQDEAISMIRGLVDAGHADAETIDLLGRAQAAGGDMRGAAASYASAHALDPSDPDVLNRLAAAKFQLGEDAEAVVDLQHSLDMQPGQDDAGVTLVEAALAHGDLPAAQDAVARLRRAHGETPLTGMLTATVLASSQNLSGAETAYRAVLNRYPETPANSAAIRQTTFGLVETLGREGDVAGVQSVLTGWTQKHPNDAEALGLLLKLLFADGKPQQAMQVAQAAHDAAPNNPQLTEILARSFVAGRQLDRAIALLDRAGAGTDAKLALLRAEALVMAGKPDQARTAFQNLLQLAPGDIPGRLGLVQLDASARNYDEARRLIHEGLAQHPGDAQLMQALVGVDLKAGGLPAALATADALSADAQNLPAARLLRASAYAASGDKAKAADAAMAAYREGPSVDTLLATWNACVRAGRQDAAESLATAWGAAHPGDLVANQLLGAAEIERHRPDDALPHLQAVLSARPNDPAALNNLAWVMLAHNDLPQARSDAQRAYFIKPGPDTADTLGWVLAKQNQPAQALPLLRQAVVGKATPSLAYHYAFALNEAGQRDQAKAVLQRVIADPQSFDERSDAQRLLDEVSH